MIVAGFGFRAAATEASLADALERASGGRVVDSLAAPADKCAAPELQALATRLALPLTPVSTAALQAQETVTQSPYSLETRATGSVAEAAALVAAGTCARLLEPRRISEDRLATCSLAKGNQK